MNETERPNFIPEEPPAEIDKVVPVMKREDGIITSNSMFVATPDEYTKKEAKQLSEEKLNVLSVLFYDKNGYLISGLKGEWKVYHLGMFITAQEFDNYHQTVLKGMVEDVAEGKAEWETIEF